MATPQAQAAEAARWNALAAYQLREMGDVVGAEAAERALAADLAFSEAAEQARREAAKLLENITPTLEAVEKVLEEKMRQDINAFLDEHYYLEWTSIPEAESQIEYWSKEKGWPEDLMRSVWIEKWGSIGEDTTLTLTDVITPAIQLAFGDLSGDIRGIMTGALEQGMGMPFAQGVPIGEKLAVQAPEVVKKGSPAIRSGYERAIGTVQQELVAAIDLQISKLEAGHSPISPEASAVAAGTIGGASLSAFIGLAAAGAAIEGATLGQLEIPGTFLLQLGSLYGLAQMIGATVRVPYHWGVDVGYNYYMASKFTPMIPPAADLVRFELREVWRPEFRPELLTPPPTDRFMTLMAYLGYSRAFAEDYWAAHWDLPSVSQGYDALHRLRPGRVDPKLVFTEKDLRDLMRRLDILPRYHDQLMWLAYQPLTRVDVRRMYRCGVLDRDGVYQAYLDFGYHPDDAELMSEFTVRYEARDEERSLGHPELIQLFKEGYMTEEQFMARGKELNYGEGDLQRYLTVGRLRYEFDFKTDQRALILEQFRKGIMDRAEATAELSAIMPVSERVAALLDREVLRMKAEKIPEAKEKILTRAEILAAFKGGVIEEGEAVERLSALKYSDKDIGILITLNMPKVK